MIPDSIPLELLFFIVTVFAGLLGTPTISLPKARLTGVNVTGATAVPVRVTICGEFRP